MASRLLSSRPPDYQEFHTAIPIIITTTVATNSPRIALIAYPTIQSIVTKITNSNKLHLPFEFGVLCSSGLLLLYDEDVLLLYDEEVLLLYDDAVPHPVEDVFRVTKN